MNEYLPLIEKLAEKLNVSVDLLWQSLLKQATFIGYLGAGLFAVLIIWGIVLLILHINYSEKTYCSYRKEHRSRYATSSDISECMKISFGFWIAGIVVLGSVASYLVYTGFYNPEYWAFKEILNALK
jgi:hypothetical protein